MTITLSKPLIPDEISIGLSCELEQLDERLIEEFRSEWELVSDIAKGDSFERENDLASLMSGKRLRPIVLFLAAQCCGHYDKRIVDAAVGIEFVHTATLLHDDVIDNATLRRGMPNMRASYGDRLSLLFGDLFFSRAMTIFTGIEHTGVLDTISRTVEMMSRGEILEIVFTESGWLEASGNGSDVESLHNTYFNIIRQKTALLFSAAAVIGGMLGQGKASEIENFARFGECYGIAYQIYDDIMDYLGQQQDTGKIPFFDHHHKLCTLPLMYALTHAGSYDRDILIKNENSKNAEVISVIKKLGGFEYSWEVLRHYIDDAVNFVASFRHTVPGRMLRDLAEGIIA